VLLTTARGERLADPAGPRADWYTPRLPPAGVRRLERATRTSVRPVSTFRLVLAFALAHGLGASRLHAGAPPPDAPPVAPGAPAPAGPALAGPLPTDPSLVTGELENGLRYVVRRHANPPGRAVIWIHMGTGSLNETDRQRGIAHYLEHMAFNGSANFPAGSLVPFFQSLGMTFGRDQNAYTNMEQTTFQLSLPDVKPETLAKGLGFFCDVLYRLLLAPKEIESERQIIQEERRRGLSGRQRARDAVLARIAPGSRYAERNPIGTEATINGFVEKDFHDYYDKWYAASNATVMVVADADPAVVVEAIRAAFGGAPKRERPTREPSGVRAYDRSFAVVVTDPEIDSEDVRITHFEPSRPVTTTVAQWRDDLLLGLGEAALNRRLEDKVARGGTSLLSARVGSGDEPNAMHAWDVSGRAAPGKWKTALEELALELQRARTFGFSARELEDARKEQLAGAQRAVETEATAAAQNLIRSINQSVTSGEPLLSPRQELELLQQVLPTIKPEDVTKRFAAEFDPALVAFVAVLPAGPGLPSEAQLLEIGSRALAVKPTPDPEVAHATQLLSELPKPGVVKEGEEHAATKVWSGWLGNDVRVHYRFMDTRKNEVSVSITLYGGELLETEPNRGITSAAQLAWRTPATKALSSSDIRELTTGKKVTVRSGGGGRRGRGGGGGGVGSASISLTVGGSPDDLETGFQVAYLLLTQPKVEPTTFLQFQAATRQGLAEAAKNPLALGMRTASSAPYPADDVRLQPLTPAELDRLTVEAAQAWLDRLVRESPIEVAIVGDLPRERALELATRYLGSLPARPRVSPESFLALRTLKRPEGPRLAEKTIDTPTPQAFVLSGFYGTDETNVPEVRALNVAAQVLSTRMTTEVREQAQLVYSIGAGSSPGGVFPGFGVFSAAAPTEPHKVAALVEKLASMYEVFAKSGPTEDEMVVAKKQTANTLDEAMRDPAYWMSRLEEMTFRGARPDDIAGAPAAYQALTAAGVKDVFAKYYAKDRAIVVVVKPKATVPADKGASPTPAPGAPKVPEAPKAPGTPK